MSSSSPRALLSPRCDDMPYVNSQTTKTHRVRVFNDPIHGHFSLEAPVLDAIDTPHVQRLRGLKQLGSTYFVYPGASHNRFEHSLGVSHLSSELVTSFYNNKCDAFATAPYDNERHFERSRHLVGLAGLCHDLGHGPFSHLFDHSFLPAVTRHGIGPGRALLQHEARSVMLFEHMVDAYNIDLERDQVRYVGELILGKAPSVARGLEGGDATLTPRFLFDVVANATTGIDTDKFDYLARDVYNVGLAGAYGFDHRRLLKFAKVIDDTICFHRKEIFNVYHLFLTRYQLHRTVYNHTAALSIDAMITDAFLHADKTLKISESIDDPSQFLRMTDSLLPIIEFSTESSLAKARHIIHRLRCRKLYRFVDEVLLPAGVSRQITPEQITTCQDVAATGVDLRPEDIHVTHVTLNFGMKAKNPVDNVLFFKDWDDLQPMHMSSSKASYLLPVHFEEKIIRVFVKPEQGDDDGDRIKTAAKVAFRRFMRTMNVGSPLHSPVMKRGLDAAYDGLQVDADDDAPTCSGLDGTGIASSVGERVRKRRRPVVGEWRVGDNC